MAEQQTIDHIAAAGPLSADWVQSISNEGPDGKKLSDHFGIAANLVPAAQSPAKKNNHY
jgi:endonuclease/exonuclease/phosphatase family metal-dependent hydrolase